MSAENPPRMGWLRIGVENDASSDQIETEVKKATQYYLIDPVYDSQNILVVGTVVEVELLSRGRKSLKPREELTPEELLERDEMEDAIHDFEFQ